MTRSHPLTLQTCLFFDFSPPRNHLYPVTLGNCIETFGRSSNFREGGWGDFFKYFTRHHVSLPHERTIPDGPTRTPMMRTTNPSRWCCSSIVCVGGCSQKWARWKFWRSCKSFLKCLPESGPWESAGGLHTGSWARGEGCELGLSEMWHSYRRWRPLLL